MHEHKSTLCITQMRALLWPVCGPEIHLVWLMRSQTTGCIMDYIITLLSIQCIACRSTASNGFDINATLEALMQITTV